MDLKHLPERTDITDSHYIESYIEKPVVTDKSLATLYQKSGSRIEKYVQYFTNFRTISTCCRVQMDQPLKERLTTDFSSRGIKESVLLL